MDSAEAIAAGGDANEITGHPQRGLVWAMTALQPKDDDWPDVRASLEGDEGAYERLVARHRAAVSAQMWRFTRDRQAQCELVQDVFVEAYLSLRSFRGKAPFLHWLHRIATRVGYRYWKRLARDARDKSALAREFPRPIGPPEEMAPSEAAEQLFRLLEGFPPKDRLVLTLYYCEELTAPQIAERMGWSATLVRVRVHRARGRLRAMLREAGFDRQRRSDHE